MTTDRTVPKGFCVVVHGFRDSYAWYKLVKIHETIKFLMFPSSTSVARAFLTGNVCCLGLFSEASNFGCAVRLSP